MRRHETRHVPAKYEKYEAEMICDLCKRSTKGGCDWGSGYNIAETEVSLKVGQTFPECGSGTEIVFDICPTCFREKLIPWLASQGAEVLEVEWDY